MSNPSSLPSGILDNRSDRQVGEYLREKILGGSKLSIVSAYFTIYAYEALKGKLDGIDGLRFLFGEPRFVKSLDPDKTDKKAYKIEDEGLSLANRLSQRRAARECSEWITNKVEIKSIRKANLLHGKKYHIANGGVEDAVMGSSNFTMSGLGLAQNASNIELNLIVDSNRDRADLKNWFDELWNNDKLVEDVKEDVLQYLAQLYQDNAPEFIYYKTLYHLFEEYLSEEAKGGLAVLQNQVVDSEIWKALFEFQKDGVKGAIKKLEAYNGCILADSVGLGKTYEALAVIKYFELRAQRVLVLCPKKLRENWTVYLASNASALNPFVKNRFEYTVLSHTDESAGVERRAAGAVCRRPRALELRGGQYTRAQLAGITREINKLFPMPVMLIFRYGGFVSLAIVARRVNRRDESRDVLEKVTLIKDIRFTGNRAQIEILHDLALPQLMKNHEIANFVDLQKAWEKTLDINELNKKFYREIANWYFWAVKTVKFPDPLPTSPKIQPRESMRGEQADFRGGDEAERNATSVIRLITRLIFVWFIKEKGLVPEALFDPRWLKQELNFEDAKKSTYYKAVLQNLFFATLNTEMGAARVFRRENAKGQDPDYLMSNFYRYKRYFKSPEKALELFAEIPFLNGGLFERLDKEIEKGVVIRVDGFSDREDNPLTVPDDLFLMEREKEIDLNAIYDTKNKKYKVRGLIAIFNSYKFTIEENTPIEEEIALDPELLGKVFENLLAAYNPETGTTARKQTGSFYTPREIVNYMVDEALVAYLESSLKDLTGFTSTAPDSNARAGKGVGQSDSHGNLSGLSGRLRDLLFYNPADPQADTSAREREIDQLVYDLYGLTEEEIGLVEA
ncbi:MAG: hypothetical protein Fur002_22510 [Anaerolineales bacterium]